MKPSLVIAGLAVQIGCGSGSTTAPPEGDPSIAVTPAVPDTLFSIGDSIRLVTVVTDANGVVVSNPEVVFSSSESAVAAVTGQGIVVSRGNGSASVSARFGTATTSVPVRVRQRLARVSIDPQSVRIGVARNRTITVAPGDARGTPMSGLPDASYASSDETVATVDAAGVVSGVAPGTAMVTASVSSAVDGIRTGNAGVTVVVVSERATVNLGPSAFSPAAVDIERGGTVTFVNDSGVAHDVDFEPTALDIPVHAAGQSSRIFAAGGTFAYHCNLHSGMTGVVFVH